LSDSDEEVKKTPLVKKREPAKDPQILHPILDN